MDDTDALVLRFDLGISEWFSAGEGDPGFVGVSAGVDSVDHFLPDVTPLCVGDVLCFECGPEFGGEGFFANFLTETGDAGGDFKGG